MYNYNEYDELNKKLYESGNHIDKLTSDPVEIARQYAAAGIDVSHYDPSTLQRAHEQYSDYEYNATWANDDEPKLSSADEAILERKMEEAQREYEEELEYQQEMAEWNAELARREREKCELEEKYNYVIPKSKDELLWDYAFYLDQLLEYPEELYEYLVSKGAYEETTTIEIKDLDYVEKCEKVYYTKTVNTKEELFINQKLISYNAKTKTYSYGLLCKIYDRCHYDLQYFDTKEWYEYIAPITNFSRILEEMELLKHLQMPEMKTPEEIATYAFNAINNDALKAKETLIPGCTRRHVLDYRLARHLAFDMDPNIVINAFERIMKQIIH